MSSTYYNECDSESEQYGEIDIGTYEEQDPYMTYDEEMAAFDASDNYDFEGDYTDDVYIINAY